MDDITRMDEAIGISLHAYFAAHAPDMPDWFECVPTSEEPVIPRWTELPRELHQQYDGLADWLDDDQVDPRVVEMRDRIEQAHKAHAAWIRECAIEKFFAWPWYYADMMMKAYYNDKLEKL